MPGKLVRHELRVDPSKIASLAIDVKNADGTRLAKFDLDIDPLVYTIGYSYKF